MRSALSHLELQHLTPHQADADAWLRRCNCDRVFFDSWDSLGRTALTGVAAYAGLVLLLRISGKRTLAKMNAFDLVVTVALGSTLSTILVSKDVPLADGVLALGLLIALQFAVAWTAVRAPRFESVLKSSPSLLLYRGELRRRELLAQRVSDAEVRAAVRSAGYADLEDVGAVVLETDGTFSVIPETALAGTSEPDALAGLARPEGSAAFRQAARDSGGTKRHGDPDAAH